MNELTIVLVLLIFGISVISLIMHPIRRTLRFIHSKCGKARLPVIRSSEYVKVEDIITITTLRHKVKVIANLQEHCKVGKDNIVKIEDETGDIYGTTTKSYRGFGIMNGLIRLDEDYKRYIDIQNFQSFDTISELLKIKQGTKVKFVAHVQPYHKDIYRLEDPSGAVYGVSRKPLPEGMSYLEGEIGFRDDNKCVIIN